MPSAKSMRTQQRRTERNKATRTRSRSRVGAARSAISDTPSDENTNKVLSDAFSALDRAASKGVIHPNNASRRKSRLAKSLNKARSGQA